VQQKYGSQGVVCLSISLDLLERQQAALTFLKSKNAGFPNYLLNEEQEFWQAKFGIKAPPAVFVFDRQGRRAGKFDSEDPDRPFSYANVEKRVLELLRKP
jgi:hypothetical protein